MIIVRWSLIDYLYMDCFLLIFYSMILFCDDHPLFRLLTISPLLGAQSGLFFEHWRLKLEIISI